MEAYCIGNGQLNQLKLGGVCDALDCMHDTKAIMERNECMEEKYVVRRLTPVEAERLQGFPDNWTNPWEDGKWTDTKGKEHKVADSNRYKALGNSIGIPCWIHILKGVSEELKNSGVEQPKMASLFDGIGGFPRIWEHINGKGSAVWASEIEEFPIAVTKYWFPEE